MSTCAYFYEWICFPGRLRSQNQEKNPFNAKSLFKRLYALAHHPNPYKRLGCSLTLLQIYPILREDESLVDLFLLEMLSNAIFSLRLAHNDDPSLGTCRSFIITFSYLYLLLLLSIAGTADKGAQVVSQLGHLAQRRAQLLSAPNRNRRMHENLGAFVAWLFEVCLSTVCRFLPPSPCIFVLGLLLCALFSVHASQQTGRPETRCRQECMALFSKLAGHVPGNRFDHFPNRLFQGVL